MDPLTLSTLIEERYRRYLQTTFYFRDPELRVSFEQALKSGHLTRGPYLEATPVFKRARPPAVLFPEIIGSSLDAAFLKAVNGDRPLYRHQDQAISRAAAGANVIVATGTGSGKTEAFLFPILLHLYQEFLAGDLGPGVRALVLYPMNALANDQRERLGDICQRLKDGNSPFAFTFGQYVGDTPEDEADVARRAQEQMARRRPGEKVLRSEMRDAPPHILLTNYSMLEYLLLRPGDSPLFDQGRARWWTFLVLDEVHQYRGSRGIEMAMLLRRLKQRLREGGRSGPFRCVATSATLAGGQDDRPMVARFASDLFGEEFRPENVILGETEPLPEPGPASLPCEVYETLVAGVRAGRDAAACIRRIATESGIPPGPGENVFKMLGHILQRDGRSSRLRHLITGKAVDVRDAAREIFPDLPEERRLSALATLVQLLLQARDPLVEAPLLSARYHLFVRSLEGAFVSYYPRKQVFLDRRSRQEDGVAFEVALCRECGQHYFLGRKQLTVGKLTEPIRDPSDEGFGATYFRPIEDGPGGDNDLEEDDAPAGPRWVLCTRCGQLGGNAPSCGHAETVTVVQEASVAEEDRADQMARCGACGYTAGGRDPVREVVYGADGPNAVIATTLFQYLPDSRKKVLAFADGRQEAAFFAWYLESSYRDILSRSLLLKAAREPGALTPDGLSLGELAPYLRKLYREKQLYPPAMGDLALQREAWRALYREFLTDEPRISLEGVGLVRWSIKWPEWIELPEALISPPWSLNEQESWDLLWMLLNTLRADRAVELSIPSQIALSWSDLNLRATQWRVRVGTHLRTDRINDVRGWDGKNRRRVGLLVKLLRAIRPGITDAQAEEASQSLLRHVWERVTECDRRAPSSQDRLLLPAGDARRLNPDWWRLHVNRGGMAAAVFQCTTCNRLQWANVRGLCSRYRCPGRLLPRSLAELEPNHYRQLYEADLPGALRVEEHTAQLEKEKAHEFQREFREGGIHVLSCSTTFELGVDLGDLDTVFLRNVPPESFNYAQRIGRAGRRSGSPGFAVTYCRRRPHDLYHFSEPRRMLGGTVGPPPLTIRNEKIIARHMVATVLSAFFRAHQERFATITCLFGDLERSAGVADLVRFLEDKQGHLEDTLRRVVPPDVVGAVGLGDGSWIERIAGQASRFALAQTEVSSDFRSVKSLESAAARQGDYDTARWAQARARTIAEEDVLSFLSRKAVIPKYGFPVDVVELDTQPTQSARERMEVSLQRDLSVAIAEFAPTSEVVANKKVWTSYGLKRVAEKEWPRKRYKRCGKHNVFIRWDEGEPEPAVPCGDRLEVRSYVIPQFGFLTNRERPAEPTSRPARVFTTRPYFVGTVGAEPASLWFPRYAPAITLKKASPALMAVLCEGRRDMGFRICATCGAGGRQLTVRHRSPFGRECRGTLEQVALGHEFVTDVLQLQFQMAPPGEIEPLWFAHSLAYALVEGAAADEVLGVPTSDLSATVASGWRYPIPPIILYDNVPGGAGLVARLEAEEVLRACLQAALRRVSGACGCAESESCYGCLRSFRNQFAHQYLQRGPVVRFLDTLLSTWT